MEILTFGGLDIRCDGGPVTGRVPRKVGALLVYLACTGRAHPRGILAELLWEERPQEGSLGNLRVALTSLRRELGEYVTITRDTVSLNPEAGIWLDAAELEAGWAGVVVSPQRSVLDRIARQAGGNSIHWLDPQYAHRSAHLALVCAEEGEMQHDLSEQTILEATETFLADLGVDVALPTVGAF